MGFPPVPLLIILRCSISINIGALKDRQTPSPYCLIHMSEVKSDMSYPVFGIQKMRQMPFPPPPLAEQHAIVERVDCLLASVNALEQQVKSRKNYAKQLMQVVLKEAFAG